MKTVILSDSSPNQFHSIYTRKDFSLTNINSFKYTVVWSDSEISHSFIF